VRKHPGGTEIPFIFLTACGKREDIIFGRSLGADDYLIKPISPEELVTAVKARLQSFEELMGS
jgi:DNA-binding response OmpR family regulator